MAFHSGMVCMVKVFNLDIFFNRQAMLKKMIIIIHEIHFLLCFIAGFVFNKMSMNKNEE